MTPRAVVDRILAGRGRVPRDAARAYAPANIALVKYWGKRDEALHLPVTGSLSISLGPLGSHVELGRGTGACDAIWLHDQPLPADSPFARRAREFLDWFRPAPDFTFELRARNTVPTAAGFASSASGFASLVKALDALFGWELPLREQSILARLGSGSAARSLADGFVEWHAGVAPDGMDSYATPLAATWPELRVGALVLCAAEKPVGSREGMSRSVTTGEFYREWPTRVARDLAELKTAIAQRDMAALGAVAEGNALAMHALMAAARPPLIYALPETLATLHALWAARRGGLPLWFTMDAGPNVKLLFEAAAEPQVRARFPGVEVVAPFAPAAASTPPPARA